ncbi:MAG TPA: clan AA aspartic protease [Pyrinomonadaceae bacterium]|nr:clan AA aspartic protease [Pyrinomonadaceae bacterium]
MTVKPANYSYRRTNGTSLTGGKRMGYVHAEIQLTNEDDLAFHRRGWAAENEIRRVTTNALVDSGAYDLIINKEVQEQLQLPVLGKRQVKLADETVMEVDIVGPVEVRFETRATTVRALVIPDTEEVLLGAIPLEGLDVIIDPLRERLLINPPENTNAKIKRVA